VFGEDVSSHTGPHRERQEERNKREEGSNMPRNITDRMTEMRKLI
jgi:hypothetical protein